MGTAATAKGKRTLQRRRIIQRPRLLALLDDSNARVRMLVAAAGYGKTTLAEQWVATDGRRSAWFTVRRSSVDVAALALGIARACTSIVPACDERLRAHLKAVSAPAGSSTILAEILSEDFTDWPSDAWLVIDDYQEISGSGEAEFFIADLVASCPIHVILTTRQRPSWVTARNILYGEILEVGQASLAMDPREAAEVLAGWSGRGASGLVALANGWPAVIGLASVSSAEIEGEGEAAVPDSLYRFFAEEVFDALGEPIRNGLTLLSVPPVLDHQLADTLLGEDQSRIVFAAALDIGLLVERDSRLEFHPLARSFLEERAVAVPSHSTISASLAHYCTTCDWDAAFDLIVRRGIPGELDGVLEAALDDLLDSARLSTIDKWCDHAHQSGLDRPIFWLARAETLLRRGHHRQAEARAEAAAASERHMYRALTLAGRAAHLASHEVPAIKFFRRAYESTSSDAERRAALWGRLLCEIEIELPEAAETYGQLAKRVRISDAIDFVRAATSSLSLQLRFGHLHLRDVEIAHELLADVDDPLVSTSFLSGYSYALAIATRYDEALEATETLLSLADAYRLDFALPHALLSAAIAHAGRREWDRATERVTYARELAHRNRDANGDQSGYSIQVRVLTQQGLYSAALAEPAPDASRSVPGQRAEVLLCRALALAVSGRPEDATVMANHARGTTKGIESAVLLPAVDAIAAMRGGDVRSLEPVRELAAAAFATGGVDLLVTAYRSCPELLSLLLRAEGVSLDVAALVRSAGDDDLAQEVGLLTPDVEDPRQRLSPREREIYGLLLQRLSNRQIAELLVIETSTVKAHTHRIYEKLGVHSRTALAIQASLTRRDYATSATDVADTS